MTTTLTILSSDPADRPGNPRQPGNRREPRRKDPVIETIRARLKAANHPVFDAPSVEELSFVLEEACADPDRQPDVIQIVGHGQPGILSLGYHFTGRLDDGPFGPFYALDSNPNVYGILDVPMKPDTEVRLLGCAVADGMDDGLQPLVADGTTLIFDLSRMWRCKVSGPTEMISAEDFDSEGIFTKKEVLQSVQGLKFVEPKFEEPKPAAPATIAGAAWGPMRFDWLCWWTMGSRIRVPEGAGEELNQLFETRVALGDVLALPEACFEVTCGQERVSAEMLGNGRVLRVKFPDGDQYFAAKPDDLTRVRVLVRQLLEPGYKPPPVSSSYGASSKRAA